MTLNEVKELIELVAQKGFAEFEVEHSGFKLKIVARASVGMGTSPAFAETGSAGASSAVPAAPVAQVAETSAVPALEAAPEPAQPADDNLVVVTSPIVGTFYRASGPTAEPFVKVGDNIDVGTVLCIVEAMKLMNEIEAEQAGEIVKIYVENGQPVEYGQPLFGIRA